MAALIYLVLIIEQNCERQGAVTKEYEDISNHRNAVFRDYTKIICFFLPQG